jgi:hypothetical protein
MMADAVLEIDREYAYESLDGVIDSASFADIGMGTSGGGGSRGDIMNRLGCHWRSAEKGIGSRIAGISQVHARLALKTDGWPGLITTRNCRNLIRTLPAMTYDKNRSEDIDDSAEDHAVDALRYGLTRKVRECSIGRVYGI